MGKGGREYWVVVYARSGARAYPKERIGPFRTWYRAYIEGGRLHRRLSGERWYAGVNVQAAGSTGGKEGGG